MRKASWISLGKASSKMRSSRGHGGQTPANQVFREKADGREVAEPGSGSYGDGIINRERA